ncbi:DUF6929 family protein [Flavobacterium sp.]|uniref:DUF6929 family protein n=1 Tax=Flavobacterium sp. TaxID=239 RepID=UPI003D6BC7CC
MEKIQLTAFLDICGIGSASGLVYYNNSLFMISDSSGFLYEYGLDSAQLQQHSLIKNSTQNIAKKQKPDFESITLKDDKLYVFGSGSTKNRNRQFIFDLKTQEATEHDLTDLYQKVKASAAISDDNLNIEGALFYKDCLYLFQRGNGANSQNGIAIIDKNENGSVRFVPLQLPKIKHVEATFTDAVLMHDKIYFLAAAEDTVSTYEDGEVMGCLIGCIDTATFQTDFTYQITDSHKFEGLTVYKQSEEKIIFLLCEDNDTEALESKIYTLEISK